MIRQIIVLTLILLAVSVAAAEDAPSMWMEQNDDNTISLMVNTTDASSGANAWIHFDPTQINITDVNFTGSPWQPLAPPGWSYQGDHVIMALTNFDGVNPGEYKIATMDVTCTGAGTSQINITHAEPVGVVAHDLMYVCAAKAEADADAVISIGDATGAAILPLTVTGAADVGACDITLSYDPAVVNVSGVNDGDMDCTYTNCEHTGEGWIRIGAIQGDNPGLIGNFTLLNITLEPVSAGASCPLTLTVTTWKDATPAGTTMTYTISNGTYTSSVQGDANDDGTVDIADAAYIAKHVIGIAGYESLNGYAADVNGDKVVDMADSMYLTKYVIGIAGFEELQ